MVSSIWTTLFDFIITMSGVAEVTRTSGGIVVGGLSEALRLGRSAYRFSSESKWVFLWLHKIFPWYSHGPILNAPEMESHTHILFYGEVMATYSRLFSHDYIVDLA